jgi:hypothetical protein
MGKYIGVPYKDLPHHTKIAIEKYHHIKKNILKERTQDSPYEFAGSMKQYADVINKHDLMTPEVAAELFPHIFGNDEE